MLALWLQRIVMYNLHYEMATVQSACFLKSGEGGQIMKSEVVSAHARDALSWDWRYHV
jgi:hypothetical protein